ncbi:MAG: CPBP family intramembrane metalloprotease [Phycisphaeraceae bacterium]|nr:CPBP family intramembrane metalloprotease [Phycisphaeraceae bacterium]
MSVPRRSRSNAASAPSHVRPDGYWALAQTPLQSLFFLLPLLVIYEIGTLFYVSDAAGGATRHILAHSMLRRFFENLGVGEGAFYLPGLIVLVVLLCLHVTRKDSWKPNLHLYPWMGLESLALSLPLFMLMLVGWGTATPQSAVEAMNPPIQSISHAGSPELSWQVLLVYSTGAGIYEELLFRLIIIALVHMVLVDLLALPLNVGAIGAVAVSAVLFALYHFGPENPFDAGRFVFYCMAGAYFAMVYLLRGFGIVAACHACYDILVVAMQVYQQQHVQ